MEATKDLEKIYLRPTGGAWRYGRGYCRARFIRSKTVYAEFKD